MNSWISESSSVSLPNLPPTVNPLPGVSVPVPPSQINYPQALQQSTSYQLDLVPLLEDPLKSSPRTACSTTLQISPVLNVFIPPSFQTVNTTRLEAINDTTSIFCPRLAELTVAPLTPFTNTPERKSYSIYRHQRKLLQRRMNILIVSKWCQGNIWWGVNPQNPKLRGYAFHCFSRSEEYEILQKHIPGDVFSLKRLRTGETFK